MRKERPHKGKRAVLGKPLREGCSTDLLLSKRGKRIPLDETAPASTLKKLKTEKKRNEREKRDE